MSDLRRHLLMGAAGLVLVIGGTSGALADPLVIDPSAPNPGGTQLSNVGGTFATDASQFQFTSDLLVQGNAANGGVATSKEVGSFVLFNYKLNGLTIDPSITGINQQGQSPLNYTIYGEFSIAGTGAWSGPAYSLSSPTVTVSLFASPYTGTQATLNGNANAGTGNFGITTGSADVSLGTFSLGGGVAAALAVDGGTDGVLTFSAFLAPLLNPDYTGANGYFENVLDTGLNLTLSTTNSTSGQQTAVTHDPASTGACTASVQCTDFYTSNTVSADGSLNYAVPEPTSLALLGSALLGLGIIRRRRNRKA